jgi:imidazole glycerol-phosphate synthase subunit HisH
LIAVVDYGMGNLRSVEKALELLGQDACVTASPQVIQSADRVILPGVGAFGAAMDNLRSSGLEDSVINSIGSGKPFLGICLGMQLLLEESDEQGSHTGLGVIAGRVERFAETHGSPTLKIPHMGWNSIQIKKLCPLFDGVDDDSMVYFVHSYYAVPQDDVVAATTNHGIDYCSVLWKDNVFATQFHPEKSGTIGLKMLANFAEVRL